MFIFYKIIESINHGNMTHVKLHLVDGVSKEIINSYVKPKLATLLEDDNNNLFRINGYFGDYIILRSLKINTHPVGSYFISKY